MPKAILEFALPEEEAEFKTATQAPEVASAVWDLYTNVRSWRNHGHQFKSAGEVLDKIWDDIHESFSGTSAIP